MIKRRSAITAVTAMVWPATRLWAQQPGSVAVFPSRPVKLVVPYAPGGFTDNTARILSMKLQEKWGQPVLVDNRAGASGAIGSELVLKSPPDGYTLLVAITSLLQAPILDSHLRYDLERDFAPVAQLGTSALVLVVSSGMQVQSMKALADALKAAPQKFSFGSVGAGSSQHLYGEQLARNLAIQPVHIAFKGAAPLLTELLADRVDFAFMDFLTTRPHIESGKLKALAVTGTRRVTLFPNVPTLAESGYPGFELTSWFALFAPKGTPRSLLNQLSADVAVVMKQPDVNARFADAGAEVQTTSPDELGRRVSSDRVAWQRLITEAKVVFKP